MFAAKNTFYEFFNSSNRGQANYLPHEILVRFVRTDTCSYVKNLPQKMRCNFIRTQPSCKKNEQFLSYLDFIYCHLEKSDSYLVKIVFILFLAFFAFYLLQITGLLTGKFFLPCLKYLAKRFRMSESLAGATLLAVANTIAGLLATFSDMNSDTTGLFNSSYGSTVLLQTLVAGLILVIQPFHVYSPTFVRDSVFFLTLITYIEYIMGDGTINLYESGFLFLYYALFLVTVAIDTILLKRLSRVVRTKLNMLKEGTPNEQLRRELEELTSEGVMEILMKDSRAVLNTNTTRSALFVGLGPNTKIFEQFLESINPIDKDEWNKSVSIQKFLLIIRVPFYLLFLLICPRVDFTVRNHGWSKLLNILQLITGPLFVILATGNITKYVYGFPSFGCLLVIASPLTIIVFFTSRTDEPPSYHVAYAFFAAVVAVCLIRLCALEVKSLTYSLTIVSQFSPSFVQISMNSWESGLGSIISSTVLASRGYPRMAFASCYGGPLFSLPLKFGVRLFYRSLRNKTGVAYVSRGQFAITLTTFTLGSALISLLGISCAKFKGRRSIGILRIIIYPLFLVYAALMELEVIHGHSTDHSDQRVKLQ